MVSSKGEPTDPELREKIKEEVKNEEKGEPAEDLCYYFYYRALHLHPLFITDLLHRIVKITVCIANT